MDKTVDTFYFASAVKPDLVNFDGDKVLLCEKKENKNLDNYVHQFNYAKLYMDRREAIDFFGRKLDEPKAVEMLVKALKDPYFGIRNLALGKLDMKREAVRKAAEPAILDLAKNDPKSVVRGRAIGIIGNVKNKAYQPIFEKAINDSSYTVSGNALEALSKLDSLAAYNAAIKFANQPAKGKLDESINAILVASGKEEVYDRMAAKFGKLGLSNEKFMMVPQMGEMLGKLSNQDKVKAGVDMIVEFRNSIPEQYRAQTDPYINAALKGIADKRAAKGEKELSDYITGKMK